MALFISLLIESSLNVDLIGSFCIDTGVNGASTACLNEKLQLALPGEL